MPARRSKAAARTKSATRKKTTTRKKTAARRKPAERKSTRLNSSHGAAGKTWHAVGDEGIPFREIAEAVAKRIGLPATSIPADEMIV